LKEGKLEGADDRVSADFKIPIELLIRFILFDSLRLYRYPNFRLKKDRHPKYGGRS